jgi:hypothetical protein
MKISLDGGVTWIDSEEVRLVFQDIFEDNTEHTLHIKLSDKHMELDVLDETKEDQAGDVPAVLSVQLPTYLIVDGMLTYLGTGKPYIAAAKRRPQH